MAIAERARRNPRGRLFEPARAARRALPNAVQPRSAKLAQTIFLRSRRLERGGESGSVVRFPTAGLVWGFRKTPTPAGDVHIVIADSRRIDPLACTVIHATARALSRRSTSCAATMALPATSPPRTAFDAAWDLSRDDLESLIEQGIQRQMFTIPTMWAVARRLR